LVDSAFELYKHGKADFSDYIILQTAREAGAIPVYTFDEMANETEGFEKP
jgi:predicted nucleic-acid-binding protein